MILVTGGAGFIGANFILDWFTQSDEPIVNLINSLMPGIYKTLHRLLMTQDIFLFKVILVTVN